MYHKVLLVNGSGGKAGAGFGIADAMKRLHCDGKPNRHSV
jgi:ATP-dependent protease ClpP protease subunit